MLNQIDKKHNNTNKNQLKSFAKINLLLKVLNKKTDNYHNIFSLIHKIELHDIISIDSSTTTQIECIPDLNIPLQENIVFKTIDALNKHLSKHLTAKITINKRIPIGAGLGGGSSNAATTLILMNRFFKLNLSKLTLHQIASQIGSDVPLFLYDYPL